MTKLGLHANRTSPHLVSFVRDAKPRIVKFLDHDLGTVKACREASPNTILIGRFFTGDQRYDQPRQNAQTLVDKILTVADRFRGLYEAWESYNELEQQNADEAKRFSEFHVHFGELMHRQGLKTIAYNFSTGVPKLEFWQYYQDGAEASDYIGLHEYDAPFMDSLHTQNIAKGEGGHYLCLRYRRVWDLLRPSARKPIIITECGIDGGIIDDRYTDDEGNRVKKLGYKDFVRFNQITVKDYMNNLIWYDDEMMKDDYMVGACIFCYGADIPRWKSFDFGDDDEGTPQAREALKQVLLRARHPLRPVSVTGQFAPLPQIGQPQFDKGIAVEEKPTDAGTEEPGATTVTKETEKVPDTTEQPREEPKPQPCAIAAAGWFAARFDSDASLRSALGCPTAPDNATFLAEQNFQNGLMIYRNDARRIYVLLKSGMWNEFPDTWSGDQPEGGFVTPPADLLEPRRGFGKVWRESLGGANAAIGFAVETEQGMHGQVQPFEQGLVMRNDRGATRILLANGSWQS